MYNSHDTRKMLITLFKNIFFLKENVLYLYITKNKKLIIMSRKNKTITEVQDQILNQFSHTIRSYERSQRNGELTLTERLIQEGKRNSERANTLAKPQSPRISLYNPNNPLNGFNAKSLEERTAIMAKIKSDNRLAKQLNKSK